MSPYVGMKFNNFLSLVMGKSFVAVVLGNVFLVNSVVTNNYLLVNQLSSQKLSQLGRGRSGLNKKAKFNSH